MLPPPKKSRMGFEVESSDDDNVDDYDEADEEQTGKKVKRVKEGGVIKKKPRKRMSEPVAKAKRMVEGSDGDESGDGEEDDDEEEGGRMDSQ